jgi:PhzF family phenazine biosynthesis protein
LTILRYTAFSTEPTGGNPAGVVLDASRLTDGEMQSIAADLAFSETAFVVAREGAALTVRYFSPLAEVPFCGHATIALAVADAHLNGPRTLALTTRAGKVPVTTQTVDGVMLATLTSVAPRTSQLADEDLTELLAALRWQRNDLDAELPPRVAFAGAWHPIIATNSRSRLALLDYDMGRLAALMATREWTTINLVWRESTALFHSRNPFPPGGVFEDPATGAAAAAFGAYLRELGLVRVPATITIHQGDDMGRPGRITVGIPSMAHSGITVSGNAVAMA